MNFNNLTIKVQEAFQRAQQVSMENGQQALEVGHLLKGLLDVDDSVTPFAFKPVAKMLAKRLMRDAIVRKPSAPW